MVLITQSDCLYEKIIKILLIILFYSKEKCSFDEINQCFILLVLIMRRIVKDLKCNEGTKNCEKYKKCFNNFLERDIVISKIKKYLYCEKTTFIICRFIQYLVNLIDCEVNNN